MKKCLLIMFCLFMVGMFLAGCGPSQEQLATQTALAAMATFEALPTATPTPTITYTPTNTPTATMTFTPTMTSTPTMTPTAMTGRIEGRIFLTDVDKTIIPLIAQITLNPGFVKTETDAQGYYSFHDIEPGRYYLLRYLIILIPDKLNIGKGTYDVTLSRPINPGEDSKTITGSINLMKQVRLIFPYDRFSVEAGDVFQMDIELSLIECIRCLPTPTP